MKKIALLLALCMVGTAVFCGCGSKDNGESSAKESSVSQSAESSDTAKEDSAEVSVTGTWGVSEIIDADGNRQTLEEFCQAKGRNRSDDVWKRNQKNKLFIQYLSDNSVFSVG